MSELSQEMLDALAARARKELSAFNSSWEEDKVKKEEEAQKNREEALSQISSENPSEGAVPTLVPTTYEDGTTEYRNLLDFNTVEQKKILDRQDKISKSAWGETLAAAARREAESANLPKIGNSKITVQAFYDRKNPGSVYADIKKTEELLYRHELGKKLEEAGEVTEEMKRESRLKAESVIRSLTADPTVGMIYDEDPEDLVETYQKRGDILGPLSAMTAIGRVGRTTAAYTQEGVEPEEIREGFWSRFFRTAPSTLFGSWWKVAKENNMSLAEAWNSKEHIHEITVGKYDIVEEIEEIGEGLAGTFGINNKTAVGIIGGATVIAIILAEPDAFSVGTLGVGKLWKAKKAAGIVKKLKNSKRLVEEQLDMAVEEGQSLAAARMNMLEESRDVVSVPLLETQRLQMGAVAQASGAVEGLLKKHMRTISGLEKRLVKEEEALTKATTRADKANASEAIAKTAEELASEEYKAAQVAAEASMESIRQGRKFLGKKVADATVNNPEKVAKELGEKAEALTAKKRLWNNLRGSYTDAGRFKADREISAAWETVKAQKAALAATKGQGKSALAKATKAYRQSIKDWKALAKKKGVTSDMRKWSRAENGWHSARKVDTKITKQLSLAQAALRYGESAKVVAKKAKAHEKAVAKLTKKNTTAARALRAQRLKEAKLAVTGARIASRKAYDDAHTEYLKQSLKSLDKMIAEVASPSAKPTHFLDDAAKRATIREFDDLSREVNPEQFLSELTNRHSSKAINAFIKEKASIPEALVLNKIRNRARRARKKGVVSLNADELASLARAEEMLVDIARKEVDPDLLPAKNLLLRLKDPDIYPEFNIRDPDTYKDSFAKLHLRFKRALDPMGTRFGDYSQSIYATARHTLNMASRMEDELAELLRGAKPSEGKRIIADLLDSDVVYSMDGHKWGRRGQGVGGETLSPNTKGYAIMNQDVTKPFEKSVEWILGDKRISGYWFDPSDASRLAEIERIKKAIKHPVGTEAFEEELASKLAVFLAKKGDSPSLLSAAEKLEAGQFTSGRNKTLDVLSRMFLPARTPVTSSQAAILRYRAYDLLQESLEKTDINRYEWFVDKMASATRGVVHDVDTVNESAKALIFSTKAIIHGAAMRDGMYNMARAMGAKLTPKQGRLLQRVVQGEYDKITPGELDDVWEALNKYGVPLGQKTTFIDSVKINKEIIRWYSKDGDKATEAFVPVELIAEFEKNMGKILKELDTFTATTRDLSFLVSPIRRLFRMWRSSVVTGVGLPNPRHWSNTFVGDWSQLWYTQGLKTASRLSFQQLPVNVPFIGRGMQDWMSAQAKKHQGKPVLGTISGALMNPHLNEFWRLGPKEAASTFIKDVNGKVYSIAKLQELARSRGVMETFVNEDLLRLGQDVSRRELTKVVDKKGGWFGFIGDWNRDIADMMVASQQRMRAGLFLEEVINKGKTPEAAAKSVMEALFDWKHGLTKFEAEKVSEFVAFYRFWRLAMRQAAGAIVEPMVKPTGEYFKAAMTGRTKMARARSQSRLLIGVPDFVHWEDPDEEVGWYKMFEEAGKKLRPWYATTHPMMGSTPVDPAKQLFFERNLGKKPTHMAHFLPMGTIPDTFALGLNLANMATMAGAAGWNAAHKAAGKKPPYSSAEKALGESIDPFIGMLMPGFQRAGRGFMQGVLGAPRYTNYAKLRPGEIELLRRTLGPAFEDIAWQDEQGRWNAPRPALALFRMAPFIGTQLPTYAYAALGDDLYPESHTEAMGFFIKNISGFGVKPYSPFDEQDFKVRELRRKLQEQRKKATREPHKKSPHIPKD